MEMLIGNADTVSISIEWISGPERYLENGPICGTAREALYVCILESCVIDLLMFQAPEGPHIFKKDGWHYLMIAEGIYSTNSQNHT